MAKKGLPVKHIFDIKKRMECKKRRQVSGNHSLNLPSYTQGLVDNQVYDITSALTDINLLRRETPPMKKVCPKNRENKCQKKGAKPYFWRLFDSVSLCPTLITTLSEKLPSKGNIPNQRIPNTGKLPNQRKVVSTKPLNQRKDVHAS